MHQLSFHLHYRGGVISQISGTTKIDFGFCEAQKDHFGHLKSICSQQRRYVRIMGSRQRKTSEKNTTEQQNTDCSPQYSSFTVQS